MASMGGEFLSAVPNLLLTSEADSIVVLGS